MQPATSILVAANKCHPSWCTPCLLTQRGNCAVFTHIWPVRNQNMQRKMLIFVNIFNNIKKKQNNQVKLQVYARKSVSAANKLYYYLKMLMILFTFSERPLVILSCSHLVLRKIRSNNRFEVQRIKGNINIFSDQRSVRLGSRQHARLKYYVKTRLRCITMAYYY